MDILFVKGKRNIKELVMTVLVPILIGFLAYLLIENHTFSYENWAANSIFPPMWLMYIFWFVTLVLMGLASYRVKMINPDSRGHVYYSAQLLLAFLWSIMFFRFEHPNISLIAVLLYLICGTAAYFEFDKCDKKAGLMMIPPLVWCVILTILSFLYY